MPENFKDKQLPPIEFRKAIKNIEITCYVYDLKRGIFFDTDTERGHESIKRVNRLKAVKLTGRVFRRGKHIFYDFQAGTSLSDIDWSDQYPSSFVFEQLIRQAPEIELEHRKIIGRDLTHDHASNQLARDGD